MRDVYDVIIVGAGPAGMTASIYAVRANMKTLLLDRLAPGGQIINSNEIENYTGAGRLSGADLAVRMFEHTRELGVEFGYKTVERVTEQDGLKIVRCEEDAAVYKARSVILATGTRPRTLGVPGEEKWAGSGISWCAICDGAQYRGKDVAVIGGGNSAVEEALYLADICARVTVVTMLDLTADPRSCDKLRARDNVEIFIFQQVLEFTGKKRLDGVRFRGEKDTVERHVKCDGVFEYIGFQASSQTFADLGITDRLGCVVVDERMRTAVPGIFGAGDITAKHLRQIVTAVSDGAIAANSAAAYVTSLNQ
ncbi:MAG: FAD-dependent oxidoreductase [Desulfovibrio sp.]|jgi:thioredoxin reductase (NADPH)|nr:FAD-dependent oxidoreductase [Desulfovibrio sp.]